jgi:glycosyltransferase involved in cell wall biosynthesis
MRVVFWSELFWPHIGGAEIFATHLLRTLQNRGYQCIVITRQDSADLPAKGEYGGVSIHRFPFWQALTERVPDRLLLLHRQVTERMRSLQPDLLHVHGVSPILFFTLETAKRLHLPLVLTLINEEPRDQTVGRQLLVHGLHAATWVTSKATSALTHAQSLAPEIIPRSSVIHNGATLPADVPTPLPLESPRLLCLGRLVPQKGFDVAIGAFASLRSRFPQLRLTIAGDGPERDALIQQAVALGLDQVIEFTGWIAPE